MNKNVYELAGSTLAGCELLKVLGSGNNGVVYLAHQKNLNRNIACKIMTPELQRDSAYMDTLFAEASNAAKLTHPNIIQALDAGIENGLQYFMMEFVDGRSLESIRVNSPEIISTDFLLKISLQLANAMDYAWSEHQMVHGDIKPGNLMISDKDHQLKVGDLGLARSSNGMTSAPEDVMITPLYAAPEIIAQQAAEPDLRSDIYSFGVMFYELACGRAPFTGTVEELLQSHLYVIPAPLITMNPDMDRELASFIDTMLAKDPDERPANWKKVRAELQKIYDRLSASAQAIQNPAEISKLPEFQNAASGKSFRNSSWSAEDKSKKLWEKYPWLLPALLIALIAIALLSLPFSLGLFK